MITTGPYSVFEGCKEAALGDLYRGQRQEENDAVMLALQLRERSGERVYVLNAWGDKVASYPALR